MKKFRLIAVFLAVLAVFVFAAAPISAAPPNVNGVEIFPGIDFAGVNWGATFVAQAQVTYNGTLYNSVLTASIDYKGYNPTPNGTNKIVGGSFSLTVQDCIHSGVIKGKVNSDGLLSWTGPTTGTEFGTVAIPTLTIVSKSGVFQHVSGGSFYGTDDHVDGPKILGITVPIIYGNLTLN